MKKALFTIICSGSLLFGAQGKRHYITHGMGVIHTQQADDLASRFLYYQGKRISLDNNTYLFKLDQTQTCKIIIANNMQPRVSNTNIRTLETIGTSMTLTLTRVDHPESLNAEWNITSQMYHDQQLVCETDNTLVIWANPLAIDVQKLTSPTWHINSHVIPLPTLYFCTPMSGNNDAASVLASLTMNAIHKA